MTFGELVELVTFEAPAAVRAFLRARFVATPEQIEATMERIGARPYELSVNEAWLRFSDAMVEHKAHEKRMKAYG